MKNKHEAPLQTAQNLPRIKTIALPTEHGGWGFILEPIVLGLLVAPSTPGVYLAIVGLSVFLARHPLRLVWNARQHRQQTTERDRIAQRFILLYIGIAALAFAAATATMPRIAMLPLVFAVPLGLVTLIYDIQRRSRALLPELTGPAALGALAPSIALAGGWALTPALALWVVILARAIPSVLYIRARLRLEKGQETSFTPTLSTHLAGLVALGLLVHTGSLAVLTLIAPVVLLLRAAYGLSPYRRHPIKPQTLGFLEIGYGAMVVLVAALAHTLSR